MSLKDDFLEALNSVKKDIFNGSEDTDLNDAQPAEMAAAEHTSASVTPPNPESFSPPSRTLSDGAISREQIQSGGIGDLHAEDEDSYPHKVKPFATTPDPSPFEYDPVDAASENLVPGSSAVGSYGSGMYEFDRTDLYNDDKTVISKNTVIRGALQTEDSVRLLGQVLGDIDCKSNIVVAGKIRGNTSAANAYIMDAQVDGSLHCDDVVSVSSDAWVLGDIRAQQAEIDGKIKGNLDVRHTVSIGSTSSIIGNISTDELEIKRGAFINGQIMMYTPSRDVIDRFEQFEE